MEGNHIEIENVYLVNGEKLLEGQGMQETDEAGSYYLKHKNVIEFSKKEYMTKGPCM